METFLVIFIISCALAYLLYQRKSRSKRLKCDDCSASLCQTCPLTTQSALQAHLHERKKIDTL